ncbi:MAG TPA: hypothetical protein PLG04_07260 [Anaerolineaceae bacterium]|nr:hypothetical protein [Anaerolineaceae bacterium]
MNEIVALQDIERAGNYIAKSGLFGVKTPEQAIALMLVAQAEGRSPFEAARDYHIIQGKPSLKAEAMLARFQQAGGKVKWLESTDTKCSAEFSHPQGGTLTVTWTIERAQKAGLTGKDNWRQYPAQMLRARCISEGVRAVYPGACSGMYTPEEIQDMAPEKPALEAEYRFSDEKPEPEPQPQPKEEKPIQPPQGWDELALKNKAKELIRQKAIIEVTQKQLWAQSGHDWAKFVELLEQEPDPIF